MVKKINNEVQKQVKWKRELLNTDHKRQIKFFVYIKWHKIILKGILDGNIQGAIHGANIRCGNGPER
jgi:hypothetical protein